VGALLLLLGLAAQDLGPRLSSKSSASAGLSSETSETPMRISVRKLVPLAGPSIMIGGAAVIVATFIGIFFQLGDQAAGRLVLVTILGAIIFVGARIPFLMRERPEKPAKAPTPAKAPKPERVSEEPLAQVRRQRSQTRRQPILFAPNQARNANGFAQSNDAAKKQPIAHQEQSEPDVVTGEPADLGSWESWPNIFESDEPIQEGLLERLLAEDPNWKQNGTEPAGEDKVIDESIAIDKAPDPATS
jgi:hypothetical protein